MSRFDDGTLYECRNGYQEVDRQKFSDEEMKEIVSAEVKEVTGQFSVFRNIVLTVVHKGQRKRLSGKLDTRSQLPTGVVSRKDGYAFYEITKVNDEGQKTTHYDYLPVTKNSDDLPF